MAPVTKSVRRIAAAAAALIVFAAPSASAQLITNGGFEAGLTDWTIDGYKMSTPFASFVTSTTSHTGRNSMRLTRQDPSFGAGYGTYLYQGGFASTNATQFTLNFWLRGNGNASTYFYAWMSDAGSQFDQVTPTISGTVNGWTQYTANFTGYNGSTYVGFSSENTVEAYFLDDVSLSAIATPEPASMVLLGTGLLGVFGFARRRRKA